MPRWTTGPASLWLASLVSHDVRLEALEWEHGGIALGEDEMTEEERLERVRILLESVPEGVDTENLLGGWLAGPVTPDRPDVPPWEYPEYAAAHPEVTFDELAHVRFPIRFEPGGYISPSSIHEFANPAGTHDRVPTTLLDEVDFFLETHAAGVWRWEPSTRTVIADNDAWPDPGTLHAAWRARIARRLASD